MSKKKAFSGNTMTLKDFHGGSIPSDLPLPSAPGLIVRPADRPGYDRQNSWGNPMPRSDHRLRPSSSGSIRGLDDKTPFLTNIANIGRNFDEDERKPLDGPLGPRRIVSDESSFRASSARSETRCEVGRVVVAVPQVGGVSSSSYSARVVERGVNSRPLSGGGSYPNAWGVRKETVTVAETVNSVSKFAQASALDQISSGRWQTKPIHQQVDVEAIRGIESPNGFYGRENDLYAGVNVAGESEREYYEASLAMHVERGPVIDMESVNSPVLSDGKEKSTVLYINEGQPAYPDSKFGGTESQGHAEGAERPKLKLLPRSKPVEVPEPSGVDYKQGFQPPLISSRSEMGGSILGNATHIKPTVTSGEVSPVKSQVGSEAGNRPVEQRPKLNLKPRSQPLDQSVRSTEKERVSLFGGARPREMVLRARGVDDIVNSHEEVHIPIRVKSPRTEIAPGHANPPRQGERVESLVADRGGRAHEKRETRVPPVQKGDVQRKNWRNDNWRNNRDPTEKQPQERERPPSPDTWRKPVEPEQPKPTNSGLRFGKAVSAAELVQAFSRSVPDPNPKPVDQFSGQRGLASPRSQVPFSRLAGNTATRPQINGY